MDGQSGDMHLQAFYDIENMEKRNCIAVSVLYIEHWHTGSVIWCSYQVLVSLLFLIMYCTFICETKGNDQLQVVHNICCPKCVCLRLDHYCREWVLFSGPPPPAYSGNVQLRLILRQYTCVYRFWSPVSGVVILVAAILMGLQYTVSCVCCEIMYESRAIPHTIPLSHTECHEE